MNRSTCWTAKAPLEWQSCWTNLVFHEFFRGDWVLGGWQRHGVRWCHGLYANSQRSYFSVRYVGCCTTTSCSVSFLWESEASRWANWPVQPREEDSRLCPTDEYGWWSASCYVFGECIGPFLIKNQMADVILMLSFTTLNFLLLWCTVRYSKFINT